MNGNEPDRNTLAQKLLSANTVREKMYGAFSHMIEGEEEKVESVELVGAIYDLIDELHENFLQVIEDDVLIGTILAQLSIIIQCVLMFHSIETGFLRKRILGEMEKIKKELQEYSDEAAMEVAEAGDKELKRQFDRVTERQANRIERLRQAIDKTDINI